MLTWQSSFPVTTRRIGKRLSPVVSFSSSSSHLHQCSLRYAVLGAGFAGLSVAWHLLEHSHTELHVCVDVLDEVGIGGGASGVSGGLLHPYSPKVKPLWRAAECWEESLRLINIAENAIHLKEVNGVSLKNMSVMIDNAQNSLAGCRIQSISEDAARSTFLPELLGRLPLRTCRGITAHLHLPDNISEELPERSPSILSDAWLAIQNPRNLYLGSTWEWKSSNYSQNVSVEEASKAMEELLPKASAVYPGLSKWAFNGASAGLRAMPPLTGNGSLPLLGQIDDFIDQNHESKFWLFSGLGSRGVSLKNMSVMIDNAQNSLAGCRIQSISEDAARSLVPNISVPSNTAFYMPDAVNIHPQNYLEI
uniref:FAD-dependent oxidoreductase family protein n=1 Tax=Tanacetum cinerariifolium TaxID=118510 RepID=A0A6L2JJK7_TANCI|nr:FAD-dependent oxidoreductase family protein [Tanacetum cinerariifolium]